MVTTTDGLCRQLINMSFHFHPGPAPAAEPHSATVGLSPLMADFDGNKRLYKTSLSKVTNKLRNSAFNRVPDLSRMHELIQYLQQEKYVPNVIYTFEPSVPDGMLHIYDGAHRVLAAQQLLSRHRLDLPVVIAVRSLRPEEQPEIAVKAEMHAINKRVVVPASITEFSTEHAILQIQRLATAATMFIQDTYPLVPRPSNNPKPPNVNISILHNELYLRLKDMFQDSVQPMTQAQLDQSAARMTEWIQDINTEFRASLGPPFTGAAKTAEDKGCFLFAITPSPLEKFLAAVEAKIRGSR